MQNWNRLSSTDSVWKKIVKSQKRNILYNVISILYNINDCKRKQKKILTKAIRKPAWYEVSSTKIAINGVKEII